MNDCRCTIRLSTFVRTVLAAQTEAEELMEFTLRKIRFFERLRDKLSERQLKVIRRMRVEGPKGFTGGINDLSFIDNEVALLQFLMKTIKELFYGIFLF